MTVIPQAGTGWRTWSRTTKLQMLQRLREMPTRQMIPSERPSFIRWTLLHRRIRDKESGRIAPFSLAEYPWLEHLYSQIAQLPSNGRLVIKKAAQIGATEFAINLSFYVLDGKGNVFYALPPGPTQGNFAHARIDPAIGASPYFREMASVIDNVGLKTFHGGHNFYIRGTSVPKGDPSRAPQLSEAPADLAVIDEFDRVPYAAVPLIRDRLGDSRLKWEIDLSTPTYPDVGIDSEYLGSTQWEPKIACQACDTAQWLDWTCVRGPTGEDPHARIVCQSCHEVIEREGAWDDDRMFWETRNPDAPVIGYWIPKLVSERVDLDELWGRSVEPRDLDQQAFWNSDMGLAYEPKGARLTREAIAACVNPAYRDFQPGAHWSAMGVDVGIELHYWVKERGAYGRERTVAVGSVLEWQDLDALMRRYGVQRCVVDDAPELREDTAFQNRWRGKVWLGQEADNPTADMATWNKARGVVRIERTKGLAEAAAKLELGIDELPCSWEGIPEILEHLTASIKAKKVREDGSTTYYYPRTGKPDHLHHAKMFCEVALSVLPDDPGLMEGQGEEDVPFVGKDQFYVPGSLKGRM